VKLHLLPILSVLCGVLLPLDGSDNDTDAASAPTETPFALELPEGFPQPKAPADYEVTRERVLLGRTLFYEGSLSRNGRVSCGSCHARRFALTDRKRVSKGIDGQEVPRNSMPLFNVAWKNHFFWDGRAATLREQVLMPIQDPKEMDETLENAVRKLSRSKMYRTMFDEAYGDPEVTQERLAVALEQFVFTRISHDSKFDQSERGEAELTTQEERGRQLFMNPRDKNTAGKLSGAGCASCHSGPLFTDHEFRNNGLAPANDDRGREAVTGKPEDRHRFVTPTLRNVALTYPYMHDGRFKTLEEVIEHYDSGVHPSATLDPNLRTEEGGLGLREEDKVALVAFLRTLSDPKYGAE
jgi:cytochrome c peroxidase